MLVIQAGLTGLFCYLGALSSPWLLGLIGGWYTVSRPIVSGLILGIIFGDITLGVTIGAAIQAVYIAMVTPGGVMPADLNFVAFPAMALAMVSNASPEVAVAIASTLGILGTVIHNTMMVANSYWGVRSEKAVLAGDEKGLFINHVVMPQIMTFALRFVPTFIIVLLGGKFMVNIESVMPTQLLHIMSVLGGILPALGIAVLLVQIVHKQSLLLYFLIGFTCVVFLKLNTLALLIIGLFLAFFHVEYSNNANTSKATNKIDDDEF